MLTRHVQRTALILGAVIAALVLFLGGAVVRLMMGPISLGPFAGAIEDSINHSVDGVVVRFDQAALEWSRADGRIALTVLGTKVFDTEGRIVAQAPKANLDFSAAEMLRGNLSLKRFALVGVQLTGVRSKEGVVRLGFGPEQGGTDLLETIRRILRKSPQSRGSLESFSIRDARLAFDDVPTGLFIVSPNADLTVESKHDQITARLDSGLEIAGVPAHVVISAVLDDDGKPERGAVELRGLSLASLGANSSAFSALKPYRLISNISANAVFDKTGGVASASFQANGKGAIDLAAADVMAVDTFTLSGRYDGVMNRVSLDMLDVQGKTASGKAKGTVDLVWHDGALASLAGAIDADTLKFDFPDRLNQPLALATLALAASYDFEHKQFALQKFHASAPALTADFSGAADFSLPGSPAIKAIGNVGALPVRDLLKYWPKLGMGAYNWIAANLMAGHLGPVRLNADIPAGALDKNGLPENALDVSFPFDGVSAIYFDGLTPVQAARGQARLTGDTFHLTASSGAVGPLQVSGVDVTLSGLHLAAAQAHIKTHVDGKMADVLALIDMPALGYPKRFGIVPSSASGQAAVDLNFDFPLLGELPLDKVRFGVQAKVAELGIPIDTRRRIDHGMVAFQIDGQSLQSQGTGVISGVPVNFRWTEDFDAPDITTRVDLSGRLDDQARANLGLSNPTWLTGPMPVTLGLTGKRFRFIAGDVHADLTNAVIVLPILNVEKRAGIAMTGTAALHFGDKGAITVTDLAASGQGLDAHGSLSLDPDGNLVSASFQDFRAGGDNDFAVNIAAMPGGGLAYRIAGASLDATKLFGDDQKKSLKPPGAPEPDATLHDPLSVTATLDKAVLRNDAVYRKVSLALSFAANERITGFSLDAQAPTKGKVTGTFAVGKNGRELNLQADDAGAFIKTFTDFTSVKDGNLQIHAAFPATDEVQQLLKNTKIAPYDYTGTLTLDNFTVANQPFIARLFSAASLDGGLRLLQGEGISITKLTATFGMRGKVITLHEGRASGSAVGATFDGILDRKQQRVDVTGTLVPAYGINSMLGALPILGNLLVSKQGEGIFGITYVLKGNLEEPALTVNPLSVLTPGILRRIFEFAPPKEPPPDAQPQAAATPAPATPAPLPAKTDPPPAQPAPSN